MTALHTRDKTEDKADDDDDSGTSDGVIQVGQRVDGVGWNISAKDKDKYRLYGSF